MRRRTKTLIYAASVMAIVIIAAVPTFFFCTFIWPYDVLSEFKIQVNEPVVSGGVMRVTVDYNKTRDWTPRRVTVSLLDGISIGLPHEFVQLPIGKHRTTLLVDVPDKVPPGHFTVQVGVDYDPFPWKIVSYAAKTDEPIEVIK